MLVNSDTLALAPAGESIKEREARLSANTQPAVFSLRAQLLDQGRTDTVLAAAEDMVVRLKVYASGGENELHAHTCEDHTFIILQGSARFFGAGDETVDLGQYQGIMLPKGAYYRFYATSTEPLVMIRVGAPGPRKQKPPYRIGIDGDELRGDSPENKTVPVVFKEGAFFGPPA